MLTSIRLKCRTAQQAVTLLMKDNVEDQHTRAVLGQDGDAHAEFCREIELRTRF